jgi:hypothetical protein
MRWVRYAYFLRFSLGLWFFPLVLCWLNTSSARTLTSGIMTPETIQQYACVGFFLVSAGFVALITARVVLINGPTGVGGAADFPAAKRLRLLLPHLECSLFRRDRQRCLFRFADRRRLGRRAVVGR